jgi:hypothetical protein
MKQTVGPDLLITSAVLSSQLPKWLGTGSGSPFSR